MRYARKLVLLAVMAMVASAFAASSASAQVEVSSEIPDTGHCAPTCDIHALSEGNVGLYLGFGSAAAEPAIGSPQTNCTNEFDAAIGEAGDVEITNQNLQGPACSVVPCPDGGGFEHWLGQIDEPRPNAEHLLVTFCVVGGVGTIRCDLEVTITTTAEHDYEFRTDPTGNGRAECLNNPVTTFMGIPVYAGVQGIWHVEDTSIEISHTS